MAARDRVIARHPKTQFLLLHVGNDAENLPFVSADPRPLPEHVRRARRPRGRARAAAARVAEVLRQVPGPHHLRHRRRAAALRQRDAAAGLRRRAVRDLLPLPRDRGRVLRLRARARCRPRDAGRSTASACPTPILKKVYEAQRGALPGAAARDRGRCSPWPSPPPAAPAAKPRYVVGATTAAAARPLLAADAAAWKDAPRITWGPAPVTTDFAALWSKDALYLRFDARDPVAVAHHDHARRAPVGGGGRGGLPRPRPLRPRLRGDRDQPRQRRLPTCAW